MAQIPSLGFVLTNIATGSLTSPSRNKGISTRHMHRTTYASHDISLTTKQLNISNIDLGYRWTTKQSNTSNTSTLQLKTHPYSPPSHRAWLHLPAQRAWLARRRERQDWAHAHGEQMQLGKMESRIRLDIVCRELLFAFLGEMCSGKLFVWNTFGKTYTSMDIHGVYVSIIHIGAPHLPPPPRSG